MSVVNIDKFKREAIKRLQEVIKLIENNEISGMALAMTHNREASSNMWICDTDPVLLIGEMNCLQADMEYYELELRKHSERY